MDTDTFPTGLPAIVRETGDILCMLHYSCKCHMLQSFPKLMSKGQCSFDLQVGSEKIFSSTVKVSWPVSCGDQQCQFFPERSKASLFPGTNQSISLITHGIS